MIYYLKIGSWNKYTETMEPASLNGSSWTVPASWRWAGCLTRMPCGLSWRSFRSNMKSWRGGPTLTSSLCRSSLTAAPKSRMQETSGKSLMIGCGLAGKMHSKIKSILHLLCRVQGFSIEYLMLMFYQGGGQPSNRDIEHLPRRVHTSSFITS